MDEMLQEAIENGFKNLKNAEGEERTNAIEEVKTLCEIYQAEKKQDFEAAKEECRIEEQQKQRKVDTIKEVGLAVLKGVVFVGSTLFVLNYEENGSINCFGSREVLKNIPKIRF